MTEAQELEVWLRKVLFQDAASMANSSAFLIPEVISHDLTFENLTAPKRNCISSGSVQTLCHKG